ncbi:hypothetical protein PV08_06116 [Exophiala spinifera]|uniref:Aminotransferase class I/classII large domain-containing protein n=1 Tax=Exophiala spinifera TaxID=91928 RepID=A0A0D2BBT5_9EURO|nr:uncharacterized protein PV08_06116 [Exophiala spinifera]KIW16065.1 hypothetical protein PV08_06116 [Exophiala spinifera]
MALLPTFELPKYIRETEDRVKYGLGGSATPYMSIADLISLSSDPDTTAKNLDVRSLKLGGGMGLGSPGVRAAIANLYKGISPDQVMTAVGTTGANAMVFTTLLSSGDHVISLFPTYGQLSGQPKGFPCEVSSWNLDISDGWKLHVDQLEALIRPNTKMIVLNNPNNPTGTYLDADTQKQILDVARKHDIIVMVDEIFRPLYHEDDNGNIAGSPSFVEHDDHYTGRGVVVTSSMSKVWGLTGARIGWIVTKDQEILSKILDVKFYAFTSTSDIDEVVAAEALSDRCRPNILKKHLGNARANLPLLDAFVKKNSDMVSWTKPTAAATAFIRLSWKGTPIDDVEFCKALLDEEGVLLSPGSLCFGEDRQKELLGFVRCHFTFQPEKMAPALEAWDRFLQKTRASLS